MGPEAIPGCPGRDVCKVEMIITKDKINIFCNLAARSGTPGTPRDVSGCPRQPLATRWVTIFIISKDLTYRFVHHGPSYPSLLLYTFSLITAKLQHNIYQRHSSHFHLTELQHRLSFSLRKFVFCNFVCRSENLGPSSFFISRHLVQVRLNLFS